MKKEIREKEEKRKKGENKVSRRATQFGKIGWHGGNKALEEDLDGSIGSWGASTAFLI